MIFVGTIILSGAVSAATLADSPQPKFQHDNNNTGQSQYKGPQTNGTKWYNSVGSVKSSPAIDSNGTIYTQSSDGNLYATNPNGTQKWSYTTGGAYSSPAIASDGSIYVGSYGQQYVCIKP